MGTFHEISRLGYVFWISSGKFELLGRGRIADTRSIQPAGCWTVQKFHYSNKKMNFSERLANRQFPVLAKRRSSEQFSCTEQVRCVDHENRYFQTVI